MPHRRGTVQLGFSSQRFLLLEEAECCLRLLRHHVRGPGRSKHHLGLDLRDALHAREELLDLGLDQRADGTSHRGERVGDVHGVAFDLDPVHEAQVDDVDPQLRVVDVPQGLHDLVLQGVRTGRGRLRRDSPVRGGFEVGNRLGRFHRAPYPWGYSTGAMALSHSASSSPPGVRMRILIVDDHPVTRDGLRAALSMSEDVEVVGEASNGEEAIELVRQLSPGVVFMDVRMPGMGGLEATKEIRKTSPDTKVILFTVDESRAAIADAIRAGVSGYLLKDVGADELIQAARLALEGKAVIHPALTRAFIEEVQYFEQRPQTPLSRRESEILQKVAYGATTKEVARDLEISPHTVKTHLERIFEKLGANDRAQAVAIALRQGLVD